MTSFASIQSLLERHAPAPKPRLPPADEIRLLATKQALHRPGKKTRTPRFVIDNLKREYDQQPSLEATGRVFGVCKSHVFYLFKRNGVARRSKVAQPRITHNGITYAFDGKSYYRRTTRGQQGVLLHKVIWEEHNGPVPADHRLILLGAPEDVTNVRCVPLSEYYRYIVSKRWERHVK
jgi:AraC-like DNA-binding protein